MGDKQKYRLNMKLRRRGEAALNRHFAELKSEDFDSDEEFTIAVASQLLEMIQEDRDYLNEKGD